MSADETTTTMTTDRHPLQSPQAFQEAQRELRLSDNALAKALLISDGKTVRRWKSGENDVPGPVALILQVWLECPEKRPEPSPGYAR